MRQLVENLNHTSLKSLKNYRLFTSKFLKSNPVIKDVCRVGKNLSAKRLWIPRGRGVTQSEGIPSDDITRQGFYSPGQTDGEGVVVYLKQRCFTGSWEVVVVALVEESLPRCREQTQIIPECQLTPFGSFSVTAPPHFSKAHVG